MYFITTKRMLEVCFFQHTPTFIIEPSFFYQEGLRYFLLNKKARCANDVHSCKNEACRKNEDYWNRPCEASMRSAASIDIRQQQKPQRQRGCTEQIYMLSGYLEIISG